MSKRLELRERYIEGWYEMDAGKLLSSVSDDFMFDDPAEPAPATKETLIDYMASWDRRTKAAGMKDSGADQWLLTDYTRVDENGVLTDWAQWEIIGTPLRGMELVKTRDDGVFLERICYFTRPGIQS